MRPLVVDTSPEPSSWTLSQAPWTPSEQDHSVNCLDPITSFLVRLVLVTTGLKDITLKEPNSSIQYLMSLERKLKAAIVCRDSRSPIHSVVVPVPEWELFWSPRSERSTPIVLWRLSPLCHHPRCPTQSLSLTTLPSQSISWSRMLMSAWSLITKLYMISASEPWNSRLPPMVIWTT